MSDVTKHAGITRAFGSDAWKAGLRLPPEDRKRLVLSTYMQALRERAGARYVLCFSMHGGDDALIYWLFFCTNSIRGIEEMKKAMRTVDKTGSLRFSDRDDPNQMLLVNMCTPEWLAGHLSNALEGKTLTVGDLREYVLLQTPCHVFKDALAIIEGRELLQVGNVPPRRKRGSYPTDDMTVTFRAPDEGKLFS